MMQKKILILSILYVTITNCFGQNNKQISKNGFVNQKDYYVEIPFNYINKHIFIEVIIAEKNYNFLFDTGSEVILVDLEFAKEINYKVIKEIEVSGSSTAKQKNSLIELPNISISNIKFEKIYAMLLDLNFLKRDYESLKISGIIGANLMRKCKWQIDYNKKVICVSDNIEKFNISETAKKIKLNNENWGLGYVDLEINNKKHKFIFDLGSGGKFTANHSFIQNLNEKTAIISEAKQKFELDKITLGEIILNKPSIVLEKDVSSLIGNAFFEDYLLTIDWDKNILFLN